MDIDRLPEVAANLAIASTLLWPVRAHVRRTLSSIPRAYALFSVGSLAVLIGAQAAGEGEAVYPLTDFGMYTTSFDEEYTEFSEYTVELSSGREERLLIGRLFPVGGAYLRGRIDDNVEKVEIQEPGSNEGAAAARLDTMLASIAREYEARHPGDPVHTIRVSRAIVPLERGGPEAISRHLIYEYHVP
ncbi:MAG TPA: hypothetical protein VJ982_02905 [Gemmatimonadota bacterium]|nr:hypothetical protein [Gemmatimonadota bacterium]